MNEDLRQIVKQFNEYNYNRYNDNYKPISQESIDYQKFKEKGLYFALISSMLIIIFILYKK